MRLKLTQIEQMALVDRYWRKLEEAEETTAVIEIHTGKQLLSEMIDEALRAAGVKK